LTHKAEPLRSATIGDAEMTHYELIHEEQSAGFTIRFYATPEDTHPRDLFDPTVSDIDEICRDIDNGRFTWFTAKVTASKNGIELAADYLGGNLYENVRDFVSEHDYYADMRATVIAEAKQAIRELTAKADHADLN
jgi:hypothetical protein